MRLPVRLATALVATVLTVLGTVALPLAGAWAVPPLTITPATLPGTTLLSTYSQTLSASGGVAPYTWSVTAGSLPAGMTLAGNGVVSGSPTSTGSFSFEVTATDSDAGGLSGSRTYVLDVAPPPVVISPSTLPAAAEGTAYSQTLTASGGFAPYTFTSTGALPTGLSLSPTGELSGTPTVPGTFNFTVTATDSAPTSDGPYTGNRAYTFTVAPAPAPTLTIAPATLPGGTKGTAYSQTLSTSGGTAPYTYATTGGALPDGLTLSSAGVLTGTPSSAGSFGFDVTSTDASSHTGTRSYTVTIAAASGSPLTLPVTTLPDATYGVPVDQPLSPTGGTPPYTLSVSDGALPAGLTLGADGTLTGTPTLAGPFTFEVTVSDAAGTPATATRDYTWRIAPALVIALDTTDVARGDTVRLTGRGALPGTTVTVTWQPSGAVLGTVLSRADGTFVLDVVVPERAANGVHDLLVTSAGLDGTATTSVTDQVTVAAATTTTGTTTTGTTDYTTSYGTGTSYGTTSSLADTGGPSRALLVSGLLLVLGGGVVVRRTRRA